MSPVMAPEAAARTAPRSLGPISAQGPVSKAARAAATAASMSSVVPSGTRPNSPSVDGLITSIVPDPRGATQSPPMRNASWTMGSAMGVSLLDSCPGDSRTRSRPPLDKHCQTLVWPPREHSW